MAFFSVIIPVYNKERFIANTLKSILAQSFTDFELILVNDGSTDQSEKIIGQFDDARIRYFANENQGPSAARNFGIAKATSEYITFIDADDYWYPNFLQEIYNDIRRFPEQKIFAAAIEIEMPGKIFPAQYSIPKSDSSQIVDYFDGSLRTTAICTSCAAFHKSVFEQVGNFDAQIISGQDTDLWIRMGLSFEVVFNPEILARYVYDAGSLSKRNITEKLNFSKFEDVEQHHPKLKRFLDLNRYAYAIKSKLAGDIQQFQLYNQVIDHRNLTARKQLFLQLPAVILRSIFSFNLLLVKLGLSRTVFK